MDQRVDESTQGGESTTPAAGVDAAPGDASGPAQEAFEAGAGRRLVEQLTELVPFGLYLVDLERGETLFSNGGTSRLLGLDPAEARARGDRTGTERLLHGEAPGAGPGPSGAYARWAASVAGLGSAGGEDWGPVDLRLRHADGSWRELQARETVFARGPDGRPRQILGTVEDVTERRAVEGDLRAREERSRRWFDLGLVGMAVTAPDRRFLAVNDRLCELLGFAREELLARRWDELTHPDDLARAVLHQRDTFEGRADLVTFERRLVRRDGRPVHVHTAARAVRGPDGAVDHYLVLYLDLSEHRAAEAALRASEAQWRTLVTSAPDAIMLLDPDLRVTFANRDPRGGAAPVAGLPVGDLVAPDDRERVEAALRRALRDGGTVELDCRVPQRDGELRAHVTRAAAVVDAGEVRGLALLSRDVTEQRRLEARLALAARVEGLGRLAGAVAHDFNNLLTSILGFAGLAQGATRDGPARAHLEQVVAAARRGAALTQQLLSVARRQVVRARRLDLRDLVDEALPRLAPAVGASARLVHDRGEDPCWVEVDPGQLEQCLLDLVTNAREALPAGGTIRVGTARAAGRAGATGLRARPHVVLSVADDGVGIQPTALPHVFEPFFSTKPPGQGVGLGLSACFGVVEQHGGEVALDSSPGGGTTVSLRLPAATGDGPPPTPSRPAARPAPGGARRGLVLLVEDDAQIRAAGERALADAGWTVVVAEDGAAALERFAEVGHEVEVVVSDVLMPALGGVELARRLAQTRPDLPVVFTSGYAAEEALAAETAAPGRSFLPKPYSLGDLVAAVARAAARAR